MEWKSKNISFLFYAISKNVYKIAIFYKQSNIMCALRDILFCVVLVTAALVLKKMMKELLFVFLVMAAILIYSRYVIAAMLVDENKRFLISSFCSSTSDCTLQHFYLCP